MSSRKSIDLIIFAALIIAIVILSESTAVMAFLEELNMVIVVGGLFIIMYVMILILPVSFIAYVVYRLAKLAVVGVEEHADIAAIKQKLKSPLIIDKQFSAIIRVTLGLAVFIIISSLYIRSKNPTFPLMLQRTTLISLTAVLLTGLVIYPLFALTASPIRKRLVLWSKSPRIHSIITATEQRIVYIRVVLAVALPVAALYAAVIYGIPQFFERDPSACAFCHTHKTYLESWQRSTHQKSSCIRCHRDHIGFSVKTAMSKRSQEKTYDYSVKCYSCHSQNSTAADNCAMHAEKLKMQCSGCHSKTGHGSSYIMASKECRDCHKENTVSMDIDPDR